MSWEAFRAVADVGELDRVEITAEAGSETESMDQASEAAKLAQRIIESGVLGKAESYHVWLSGHANPKHKEIAGLQNDTVSVTVSIGAYPGHSKRYAPETTPSEGA